MNNVLLLPIKPLRCLRLLWRLWILRYEQNSDVQLSSGVASITTQLQATVLFKRLCLSESTCMHYKPKRRLIPSFQGDKIAWGQGIRWTLSQPMLGVCYLEHWLHYLDRRVARHASVQLGSDLVHKERGHVPPLKILLEFEQRKDNSDLRVKTLIPQGQLTGWSQA